jgi:Family of unknown function (DUF5931)
MAGQMWRVVAVFRIVTLAYAAVLIIRDHHSYAHPAAGFLALAVMSAWTVVTVVAYARPQGRTWWLVSGDVRPGPGGPGTQRGAAGQSPDRGLRIPVVLRGLQ